jgi:outer membrane receptor protein involved in Fe transport
LRADFANTAHLPQYYQINLSAGRAFEIGESKKVNVTVAAINVTDRSYLLRDGSGIGVGAPQYGPRRGLFLGLDMAF